MYRAFFGMKSNPFRKGIPVEQLFESEDLKAFRARMHYFQQTKGIGVVYGRPGMGKTTALRSFVEGLNRQLYFPVYQPQAAVTVMEFYRGLCLSLGLEPAFKKIDMFRRVQGHIQTIATQRKQTPIFMFDEAQFLSQSVLNELRMLFNFHMDSKDYAMVLLCGQNRFVGQLNLHGNEPLRQRIMVHYEFQGLAESEVGAFLDTLFEHAGVEDPVFAPESVKALAALCEGSPRLLGSLVDKCLILGYQNKQRHLDAEIVRKAHEAGALFAS